MNNTARLAAPTFRPTLALRPDMAARWQACDLSFDAAAERLIAAHQKDGAAEDIVIADLPTWGFVPTQDGHVGLTPLRGGRVYPLRDAAFSAFCDRLVETLPGVRNPAGLIRALPAQLQLANVNYLMATSQDKRPAVLRTRGGEVASVVSGSYTPYDVAELMTTVRAGLVRAGMLEAARVRAVSWGLRRDGLRVVFPSVAREIRRGDVTQAGFTVWSSDAGASAIHLAMTLYRLVCENGLVTQEDGLAFRFNHTGDRDRLRSGVENAVESALVRASGLMDRWQTAVVTMVDDVEAMVRALQAQKMTEVERANVAAALTMPDNVAIFEAPAAPVAPALLPKRASVYDITNAMTHAAKAASPARRGELEEIAAKFLTSRVAA